MAGSPSPARPRQPRRSRPLPFLLLLASLAPLGAGAHAVVVGPYAAPLPGAP